MANGKKNEQTKAIEQTVTDNQTETETKNLIVERETFTGKDGEEYWSYAVKGTVRGRETKVDFVAADQGGYEVLDIIFDIKPTAELVIRDEVMVSDDGTRTPYTVYEVQNVDENGEIYSYQVKPARKSDKSLLNFMLMERARKEVKKA